MKKIFAVILFIVSQKASAADMTLRARGNDNLSDFFFSQMAATSSAAQYLIRLNVSCFAANQLNVVNPLAVAGLVRINIGIGPNSDPVQKNGSGDFNIEFPGWIALAKTSSYARRDIVNLVNKGSTSPNPLPSAFGVQNTVVARPPAGAITGLEGPRYPRAATLNLIRYINFEQDIQASGSCWGVARQEKPAAPGWLQFLRPAGAQAGGGCCNGNNGGWQDLSDPQDDGFGQPKCNSQIAGWDLLESLKVGTVDSNQYDAQFKAYKEFTGKDGALSGEWKAVWSSDYKTLIINVAFPGDVSICGSYYSPLMLFFDSRRPRFSARTDFEIHPRARATYWPEKEAPGYFLALDRNDNGRIDDWTELFGDDRGVGNGFEKLRELDANHDGVIDEKDPDFRHLLLWGDRTGTGKSRPEDLHTLEEMGVKSISLAYTSDRMTRIEDRALLREKSTFVFVGPRGEKKGEVIDVWLSN